MTENIKASTTQLLNLAQARQIVDTLKPSQTRNMLDRALWHKTKTLTGMSGKKVQYKSNL